MQMAVGLFQQVFPNLLTSSTGTSEPSNAYLWANQFLTALGEDTALSGCQYYVAIGAAGGCRHAPQAMHHVEIVNLPETDLWSFDS